MTGYPGELLTTRTAMVKALEHLEKGNLEKAKAYLADGLRRMDEVVAFDVWDECGGNCESCDVEACRDFSEREELEFSKMMKKFAILRMRRSIEKIDRRLDRLPR